MYTYSHTEEEKRLLMEFERMLNESNNVKVATPNHSLPYPCNYGTHSWKWYVGLHMDRYWYCTICDEKDYKKEAPKS